MTACVSVRVWIDLFKPSYVPLGFEQENRLDGTIEIQYLGKIGHLNGQRHEFHPCYHVLNLRSDHDKIEAPVFGLSEEAKYFAERRITSDDLSRLYLDRCFPNCTAPPSIVSGSS